MKQAQTKHLLELIRFEYGSYLNANYSQESVGIVANNILDNVLGFLPNALNSIQHFKVSFFDDTQAIKLNKEHKNFVKDIERRSYSDTRVLRSFAPEGMNKTYLEYAHALSQSPSFCAETEKETLTRFSALLGHLVTNKSEVKSIDTTFTSLLKQRSDQRDVMLKNIGACFQKGSTATETTYGGVVSRNSDLVPVFVTLEKMVDDINKINRTTMMKLVDECVHLLEILMRKFKNGELSDISPEMLSAITEGTYHMAEEVEFFAATHYRIFELNTAVSDTVKFVHDIVKQ